MASNFEKLWSKILKNFGYVKQKVLYQEALYMILGNYLVYLASIGRYNDINKTLNMWSIFLYYNKRMLVLTRLMLRLLVFTKVDEVKPEELIDAYKDIFILISYQH